jgi:hypothetical protein
VPVQSRFTEHVPFIVAWNILPFGASTAVPIEGCYAGTGERACLEGWGGRGGEEPVMVYASVLVNLGFEHPLSAA